MMGKPHVVILGAGTSLAACPNGDATGKRLPLMMNFVEVLGLSDLLKKGGVDYEGRNFEDIYDHLHRNDSYVEIRESLERTVYDYFAGLSLPDKPTIYDHLILSLRAKDRIATFNWDPFLVQAFRRNAARFKKRLPRLLFLHGNVSIGYCENDRVMGFNGNNCSRCENKLHPSRLLYPITEKNYHLDEFISTQWDELQGALKIAFMITTFGYSAPKSDVSAVKLLKEAWGDVYGRNMEQTEIIDIREEANLRATWKPFIHTHHYEIHDDFYDSWIGNHPRRSGEAYWNQYWEAKFIDNNPVPKNAGFEELWDWFNSLIEAEEKAESEA